MTTSKTAAPIAKREPLTAVRIVTAGIELADADGASSLTMRRLADHLGFKVMALYNHVANKDELLALMVDAVVGSIELPAEDEPAMAAIRAYTIAIRDAFVRHPWSPGLWQRYLPGPHGIDHMEQLLATFARSGLPADIAHHGFHAVINHVLGYTLQEEAMEFAKDEATAEETMKAFIASVSTGSHPHTIAHVHQHLDGDTSSSFALVLDLILDGLTRLAGD